MQKIEDLNHTDSIFNLNKNVLFCDSIDGDILLHYKTNKTLNLLVLTEEPEYSVELCLKDKIKNNGRIDGFIFKSKENFSDEIISYIKIYLKDVKKCVNYIETITDGKCEKNKIHDHIIISENNISSFYVDNEFNRLKI